jgi:cytochrome b561
VSQGDYGTPLLLIVHRSMGVVTWIVVMVRLAWRHVFAHLPPFPAGMSKLNQRAAKLNEYGLYALLVIEPLAGIGNALFRGKPFALFAWQVPAIMAPEKNVSHMFHAIHEWGGWALLVLVGLHAAAGLFHGLILRDGVFQRMMPWMEPQGPGRDRRMLEKGVPRIGFASDIKLAGNKDADGHDHLRANRDLSRPRL